MNKIRRYKTYTRYILTYTIKKKEAITIKEYKVLYKNNRNEEVKAY